MVISILAMGASVNAQIEWTGLPTPAGLNDVKKIEFKGDSIVLYGTATGKDIASVTVDRGKNWNSTETPSALVPTGVWFQGYYYAIRQDGVDSTEIFRSKDMVSFEKVASLRVIYLSLVSTGDAIIGLSSSPLVYEQKNWRSFDGISWDTIPIGNSRVLTFPVVTGDTIRVLEFFSLPKSVLWMSSDKGSTWCSADTLLFNPLAVDSWNGKFEWVGGSGTDTLPGGGTTEWQAAGRGQIDFNGPRKIDLMSVTFFMGDWYMAGATYDDGTGWLKGVLMKNGNKDSITYFDGAPLSVYSDHENRIVLVESYNKMWINKPSAQGFSENGKPEILVYPNPTTGQVNIVSSKEGEGTVYNTFGETIGHYNLQAGKNIIDLTDFPSGIYFLSDGKNLVTKIMKQ